MTAKESWYEISDDMAIYPLDSMVVCERDVDESSSTGLYGLEVHPNPRPALISLYNRILNGTSQFPSTSIYAQSAAALAKHRLAIVEKNISLDEIEKEIDAGQVEELIQQAEAELKLLPKMLEAKVWEPLETSPPKGQWNTFVSSAKE